MNLAFRLTSKLVVSLLAWLMIFLANASPQVPTGSLRGQVTDPSGAAVAGVTIVVLPAEGPSSTTTTNRDGVFELKPLAPGNYIVQVFARGFAQFEVKDVAVTAGSPIVIAVHLSIEEQKEKVVVSDSTTQLATGRTHRSCRPIGWTERRADLHRWLYRRPITSEIVHPRNPPESKPVFRRIRQARLRPYRNSHQAGH